MSFKFSKASENKFNGVHPDLVKVARLALELSEVDFGITEGMRSLERQLSLFEQGKSKTLKSKHLEGRAIDVHAVVGGTVSWMFHYYETIARAFKQAASDLNIEIEWGGDWEKFRDGVHFQLKD